MLSKVDKKALIDALCAQLAEKARVIEASAEAARDAATHEESKPENDKDTRALEASYLAGAQAARARELKALQNALAFMPLKACETVDAGALVEVHAGPKKSVYFVALHGGGMKATIAGVEVTVIAPDAPLGQALLGNGAGDEVAHAGKKLKIAAVR